MSNNNFDYLEQLFEGISIIARKQIENVSYDKTIICTITNNDNSKNGEYQVTDGSAKFTAYSENSTYKVNDQVRVQILQGDMTGKKYIIGKHQSDEKADPITYVSPTDTIIDVTGNIIPAEKSFGSIMANGPVSTVVLWSADLSADEYSILQTNGVYTNIVLKADFRTLLSQYKLKSGDYGLRLDLFIKPSPNTTVRVHKYIELNTDDMFGDPYSFAIFSPQAKVFSIGNDGVVDKIALSLFQNNQFIDGSGNRIDPNKVFGDNNIQVKNIQLGLGTSIENIPDNTVKIFTKDNDTYKYHEWTEDTNSKDIGLLWYNKNKDNQYIGFSDGIYDFDYDELEYIKLSTIDNRLSAQIGRDGVNDDKNSLTLAANIEDAVPLIKKARNVMARDLKEVLQQFDIALNGLANDTPLKNVYSGSEHTNNNFLTLNELSENIELVLENLINQYSDNLRIIYNEIQNGVPAQGYNIEAYGQMIKGYFDWIRQEMLSEDETKGLFANIYVAAKIENENSGYQSIYDTYYERVSRILNLMDSYLTTEEGFPVDVINGKDFTLMKQFFTGNAQVKEQWALPYIKTDLSVYDNKYCIYWYYFDGGYVPPATEAIMPNGWRRIEISETAKQYRRAYLKALSGDKIAFADAHNLSLVLQQMEPRLTESDAYEKDSEGLIHFNEDIFKSIFYINLGVPGKASDGMYNAVACNPGEGYLKYTARYDHKEERLIAVLFYNHEMFRSQELVFTNTDHIPDLSTLDKGDIIDFEHLEYSKDSYQVYSLTNYLMDAADAHRMRQIRAHYNGLLAGDEALVDAKIYWYVPINSTMLTYDKAELLNKGFVCDEDVAADAEKPAYHEDGYVCFYKQIKATKIEATEDAPSSWDFVTSGLDSRDFWYQIKPYYEPSATQNSIICQVELIEDRDPVQGEAFFTFGKVGTSGTKYTLFITPNSNQAANTNDKNGQTLNIRLEELDGVEIPLYRSEDEKVQWKNVTWDCKLKMVLPEGEPEEPAIKILPDDESLPVTNLNIGRSYFGIIKASATISLDKQNGQSTRTVNLATQHAIPWAAGRYYLSGPTQIIYNNLGTLDNMSLFDKPYKLYEIGTNKEIENITWSIEYYRQSNSGALSRMLNKSDIDYDLYSAYMPVLEGNGSKLVPNPMYLDGLDCYPVIVATSTDKVVLWKQPIIITQNRYFSAMINDWDGSFTIDEENGTIMATMLGAGRKSRNNTFEGVLMGDVQTGAGTNAVTELGIYGFHDGAQSFGFKVDGTAFLGKAGRGRIKFNGNKGSITSASYEEAGGSGMYIDLDDGWLHMRDVNDGVTNINLNSQSKHGAYFSIDIPNPADSNRQKNLIYISNNDYYLQTADFTTENEKKGVKIDLKKGRIDAYQFTLDAWEENTESPATENENNSIEPMMFMMRKPSDVTSPVNPAGECTIGIYDSGFDKQFTLSHFATEIPEVKFTVWRTSAGVWFTFDVADWDNASYTDFISDVNARKVDHFTWNGFTYTIPDSGKETYIITPMLGTINLIIETVHKYPVHVELNGGYLNGLQSFTEWGTSNSTITICDDAPLKEGSTFKNWTLTGAGSITQMKPYIYTFGTGEANLKAEWSSLPITYTVYLDELRALDSTSDLDSINLILKLDKLSDTSTQVSLWFEGEDSEEDKYIDTFITSNTRKFIGINTDKIGAESLPSYKLGTLNTSRYTISLTKGTHSFVPVYEYPLFINPNGGIWRGSANVSTMWEIPTSDIDDIQQPTRDGGYTFNTWIFSGAGDWYYNPDYDSIGSYTCREGASYLTAQWTDPSGVDEPVEPDIPEPDIPEPDIPEQETPLGRGRGIYINSNPINESYLKVGSNNDNFLNITPTLFEIKTKGTFLLDGWDGESDNGSGIYIQHDDKTYAFRVGSTADENKNFIELNDEGLNIETKKFLLDAWTGTSGLYINSTPSDSTEEEQCHYFKVGSDDKNLITMSSGGGDGLVIKTQQFTLEAGETQTITIDTTATADKFPFEIKGGNKADSAYAKIGWDGVMRANGAKLDNLFVYKSLTVATSEDAVSTASENGGEDTNASAQVVPISNMMRAINPSIFYPVIFGGTTSGGSVSSNNSDIDISSALVKIIGVTSIEGDTKIKGVFNVDGDSKIMGTTIITGDLSLGDPNNSTKKVNLGISGNTEIAGNITMGGDITMLSGKQIKAGENTSIVFTTETIDTGATTGIPGTVQYDYINFVGNTKISGNLEVTANTKFPSPNNILIKDNPTNPKEASAGDGYYTLPNYIKNNSESLFSISWTDVDLIDINFGGTANYAKQLVNANKDTTLIAPSTTGKVNQILVLNSDGATAKWGSLQVLTLERSDGTVAVSYDGTSSKRLKFGKLAFADEVKKKVTVNITKRSVAISYPDWQANTTTRYDLYTKSGDDYVSAGAIEEFDGTYSYGGSLTTYKTITVSASEDITFTADGNGEATITSGTITVS